MDPAERISQLESEVERLETRVARLQDRLASSVPPRHAGRAPKEERSWLAKLVLLAVTAAVAFATAVFLTTQNVNWAAFSQMGSQMAALRINYELLSCAGVAALSLLLYLAHRRLAFLATAMGTLYLTYWFFLRGGAGKVPVPEWSYFAGMSAFLTLFYVLCSGLCVRETKAYPHRSGRAAILALLNSAGFYLAAGRRMLEELGPRFWVFLLAYAVVLSVFTVLARTPGRTRNYVMPLFLVKSVLVFTLFLQALFDGPFLWIALALECFALALLYRHTGIVLFKVLNLVLVAVITAACIGQSQVGHAVMLGRYALPDDWLMGVAVPAVFIFTAWFYEHFAGRLMPAERRSAGQWYLADSLLDVPSASAAMLHAAGAALIPVLLTIANRGDQATLPYVLGVESLVLAVLGLVIRTQQVEVAAILLLVAAHVSFYFFLAVDLLVLETAATAYGESLPAGPLTLLLILFSYAMGYGWERYLRRIPAQRAWEHELFASIPYLLATLMAAVFVQKLLPGSAVSAAQGALALVLTVLGLALPHGALAVAGLAGFVYSGAYFVHGVYRFHSPFPGDGGFVYYGLLLAGLYVAAERAFVLLRHRRPGRSGWVSRFTRTGLTAAAVALAGLVLGEGLPGGAVLTAWLGLAAALTFLGWVFGENRYRWGTVAVLVACAVAARQPALKPAYLGWAVTAALGMSVATALAASWFWTYHRLRTPRAERESSAEEGASVESDGGAARDA